MRKTGTSGADTITGTEADDWIDGQLGDDVLSGEAGADWLIGGDGRDRLDGGAGRDMLLGDAGDDQLIDYSADGDTLDGSAGNDMLRLYGLMRPAGSVGSGFLSGGDGDDDLAAFNMSGRIAGGAGMDVIAASEFAGKITAGAGNDWVSVKKLIGAVRVELGQGNDVVEVNAAARVTLSLGAGMDTLILMPKEGATPLVPIVVTDFRTGIYSHKQFGDRIAVKPFLDGYGIASADPFADGYMKLVQRGADTFLMFDRDRDGTAMDRLVVFQDVDAATFQPFNLSLDGAYVPSGLAPAGAPEAAALMM